MVNISIYPSVPIECQCSDVFVNVLCISTDCVHLVFNELLMQSALCHPADMTTERCCTTPLSAWYLEDDGWVPFASWRLCRLVTRTRMLLIVARQSCY